MINSLKIKIAILAVIVIAIILILMNNNPEKKVIIEHQYPDKVVYTLDLSTPREFLIEDCQMRGGQFNSCGSPCAPEEESVCDAPCAYVCEL